MAPGPHGGAHSTAEDLIRFAESLTRGLLIRRETLDQFVATPTPGAYARGFETGGEGTTRFFGHQGGAPGANTFVRVFPEAGYIVVVLSNTDNGASLVGGFISTLLK